RDLPMGGDLITRDIARFFNVDFDRAENMKFGGNLGNISPRTLQNIFARHVELFASELKRTLEFFTTNLERDHVKSIFLSGGAAATYGFASALEGETGIPVHMVDPFRLVGVDPNVFDSDYLMQVGPSMAVAVGLALRHERDKADA
ncbi:MAG: type pilus assembly protein PilM, partial [Thermodesulfobacteriota bacterium]|nr:type pilus assembly protein PilM [Thermodesulfobacteriota bacterium]